MGLLPHPAVTVVVELLRPRVGRPLGHGRQRHVALELLTAPVEGDPARARGSALRVAVHAGVAERVHLKGAGHGLDDEVVAGVELVAGLSVQDGVAGCVARDHRASRVPVLFRLLHDDGPLAGPELALAAVAGDELGRRLVVVEESLGLDVLPGELGAEPLGEDAEAREVGAVAEGEHVRGPGAVAPLAPALPCLVLEDLFGREPLVAVFQQRLFRNFGHLKTS